MSLVNTLDVTVSGGGNITLAHGITDGGESATPDLVMPTSAVDLVVSAVTATQATFTNSTAGSLSATFYCQRTHTLQRPGDSAATMYWQGTEGGMAIDGAITSATEGSIFFAGASGVLAQDNSNLFWDNANNALGIGTASAAELSATVKLALYPNADTTAIIGRTRIDSRIADGMVLSHYDFTTTANFALWQAHTTGITTINSPAGQVLNLGQGGSSKFQLNSSGHLVSTTASLQFQAHGSSLVSAPGFSFTGDPNTGIYPVAADTIGISCGGALQASFGVSTMGFFGTSAVVKQTSGANLTNSVTAGGVDDTIANYTDLTVYANDSAAIRNDIYQLSRKLKQINDGLRSYGLFT